MGSNLRKIFLVILIVVISNIYSWSTLQAQNPGIKQTIRGKVIDRDSKFEIPGANVIIRNSSPALGASSDSYGNFEIRNVPTGRHDIEFIYIGYKTLLIPNVLVGSGKEVILNAELEESLIESEAIVVRPDVKKERPVNEMASTGARAFTVEETGRYAASINDPARMALSFAGVTNSSSDAMNEIVIRGNSPRGMQWNVEGIPVSNPNHFAEEGNTGGAVCLISNNMLDNSDFFTGAWPANFGNALSGIFDINFRKGNTSTYEHAFQFSPLGVDLSSEGPLPFLNGASYLVNYRYSTLSIFDAAGIHIIEKNKGLPDFQDLSYKFYLPTKSLGVFSIWGIGGLSKTISEAQVESGLTWDNQDYKYLEEEGEKVSSDIGIAGISHLYFMDKKSYLKSAFSVNGRRMTMQEEGLINKELKKANDIEFKHNKMVFSSLYNRKFSARSTLQTGFILSHFWYNSKSYTYNETRAEIIKNVNVAGNSNLYQGYIQSKYKWYRTFTLFTGIHSSYFGLNDTYTIEPRIAQQWQINDRQSVSIGLGWHSQLNPISLYLMQNANGYSVNKDLDFLKARHYALSYDYLISDQWRIKVELYYQDLYSIPIAKDTTNNNFNPGYLKTYSALNAGATMDYIDLVSKGSGKNYGIELTIEKFFKHGWYFLSTNSFYQAKYKGFDGIERDTKFNGNYAFNLVAGKEINTGNNNILGMNTRIIRAGGKRDTPVLTPRVKLDDNNQPLIDDKTGQQVIYAPDDYDHAYSRQLPDYFRIDLGISYRINFPGLAHIFALDFQNILNKENIRKIDYYDVKKNKYIYKTMTGIIPSIRYRLEF